jgi:hypothetical protein
MQYVTDFQDAPVALGFRDGAGFNFEWRIFDITRAITEPTLIGDLATGGDPNPPVSDFAQ